MLAQLGSRVQHQLRAFTPDDAKALRATVSTYPKSGYDLAEVLQSLGTGEAIVTVMNEKGAPSPGRVDAAARAAGLDVADAGRADRRDRRRVAAARDVRHGDRPRLGPRDARRASWTPQPRPPRQQERVLAQAKAAVDAQKAAEKAAAAQAKAQKAADAEYDRLLKATGPTARGAPHHPESAA